MTSRKSTSVNWIWLIPLAVIIMEASIDLATWMGYVLFNPLGPLSPLDIPGLLLPAYIRLQLLVDLPMFALVFAYYFIGSTGHKTRVIR